MSSVILRGLRHAFGALQVLDGVDLEIEGPGVYGLLGVNGSGKTTTLRILCGFLRPDAGELTLLGRAPSDPELRREMAFLPQAPEFYPWMSGEEFLVFSAELYGFRGAEARRRARAASEQLGLGDARHRRAGTYSGGMKQRLGLAGALLAEPRLLLLDEPVSALDPVGRKEVLDLLQGLGTRATVLLSSHILGDVARVCDRVAILHKGRVRAWDTPAALGRVEPALVLRVEGEAAGLVQALRGAPWVRSVAVEGDRILLQLLDAAAAARAIPGLVAGAGLGLLELRMEAPDLEAAFLRVVGATA